MEGTKLGAYRLLSELGTGGMGTVYLAEVVGRAPGLEPGERVALKVVHPHLQTAPGFFKRFLREAEIGGNVRHDNVVRCFDCDALPLDGHTRHFLVMEYVEGQTLRGLLDEMGTVPEELCRHVGQEIARGLGAIHGAGAIHRDLKPENVLITAEHRVKIMDLGVALLLDEAIRLSQTGHFVGSVLYAAPEAFRGGRHLVDARSDLYGLGVLLYELVTGLHPFGHDDFKVALRRVMDEEARRAGEVNPQLSPFFEEFVHTLVAKEPEARFADADEVLRVLEQGERSAWWETRATAMRQATKRPLRRIRIPRETDLYGRDDEVARMRQLYEEAKAGEGRVLLIEGEAGIGKTRLVDEVVSRLRQDGEEPAFLYGSYPPGGAATASGAFSTAYREHFGAEGLEDTLKDYLRVTQSLVPAFASLLRGEPPPTGEEPLTKDSLQTVFVHATRGIAAEHPTVILIDDLHFAPAEGRALFTSLALAVPGHRILLVGTIRPGMPADWIADIERFEHTNRMALPRLGPKDLSRLLEHALHSHRLAEKLGWQIATKSDGNPFFVFEIIRGLREGQLITQRPDGSWVTTEAIREVQVPSSILDLVNARVADLEGEERDLLEVACCLGHEFDPTLLAEATGRATVPTLKQLGQIERKHRLVRAAGRRFVFDHHQVQEALYGRLSEPLREAYHLAIGDALEAREGGAEGSSDGARAASLCEHLLAGGQGERALPHLDAALDHLEEGTLNDQAGRLASRALGVPGLLVGERRIEVLLRNAKRWNLQGRPEEERHALDEAAALAAQRPNPGLEAHVRTQLGWHLIRVCENAEAVRVLTEAAAQAKEAGDEERASAAEGTLGLALLEHGQFEEAHRHLETRLHYLERTHDVEQIAGAWGNVGLAHYRQGRREEAVEAIERGLALARERGQRRFEASALGNLSILYRTMGREVEAKRCAEEMLPIARAIGSRITEANGAMALGAVVQSLGPLDDVRAYYERALEIYQEIGDRRGEAYALGNLGGLTWALGLLAESRAYYDQCIEVCRDIEDGWGLVGAMSDLAYVHRLLGHAEEARAHFEEALAKAEAIGHRQILGESYVGLAEVAEDVGDLDAAHGWVEKALLHMKETGEREGLADALRLKGHLLALRGDDPGAIEALEEATQLGRSLGLAHIWVRAAAERAGLAGGDAEAPRRALEEEVGRMGVSPRMASTFLLWRACGDPELLEEARRHLEHLVLHAPPASRDDMRRQVPLHRAIQEAK